MNKKITKLVNRIKNYLLQKYRDKIKNVILYGSQARGSATKHSDIDVIVLVDDSIDPFDVRRSLSNLLFDILLEDKEFISVVVLPKSFFENYNYPFMRNVKKDGVNV